MDRIPLSYQLFRGVLSLKTVCVDGYFTITISPLRVVHIFRLRSIGSGVPVGPRLLGSCTGDIHFSHGEEQVAFPKKVFRLVAWGSIRVLFFLSVCVLCALNVLMCQHLAIRDFERLLFSGLWLQWQDFGITKTSHHCSGYVHFQSGQLTNPIPAISPGFPDSEAIEDPRMSGLFRNEREAVTSVPHQPDLCAGEHRGTWLRGIDGVEDTYSLGEKTVISRSTELSFNT